MLPRGADIATLITPLASKKPSERILRATLLIYESRDASFLRAAMPESRAPRILLCDISSPPRAVGTSSRRQPLAHKFAAAVPRCAPSIETLLLLDYR